MLYETTKISQRSITCKDSMTTINCNLQLHLISAHDMPNVDEGQPELTLLAAVFLMRDRSSPPDVNHASKSLYPWARAICLASSAAFMAGDGSMSDVVEKRAEAANGRARE